MINYENYSPNLSFFAASNGYCGFTSLFDQIFDPIEFKRIFILKGGPGTGKSTLMKGIIKFANRIGIYSEAVYCSSDTNSLDGVILIDNEEKVAVIDGTAPHATDPKYPGAIDEIINLGEGFNEDYLTSRKKEIVFLNIDKSDAYKQAYSFLKLAGNVHQQVLSEYKKKIDDIAVEKFARSIYDTYESGNEYEKSRKYYLGSFSKFGYTMIDNTTNDLRTKVLLSGDGFAEQFVIKSLYKKLSEKRKVKAICPSPFSEKLIDAVCTDKYVFKTQGDCDININLSDICRDPYSFNREMNVYQELIDLSIKSFQIASNNHFKLEAIYSEAMDYSHNDEIFHSLVQKIDKILS